MSGAFTNAGGEFYVCVTAQPNDLDQAGFEALSWVKVGNVGKLPQSGTTSNIVKYPTLDTDVVLKNKGTSDGGDGDLEVARSDTDAGQVALRAMAATKFYYATKRIATDAPSSDYTNSIFYNRGLVSGPGHPGGGNEDFILETFQFGNVQREVVVGPVAQVVPVNVLRPAISGLAKTGNVLTASFPGSYTPEATSYAYQWQHDSAGNNTYADIGGATAATFTCVVGDVGNSIRLKVTPTNGAGAGTAVFSGGTSLQIA